MYQCKNERGEKSFQDKPCADETIKVSEMKSNVKNEGYKNEMIKALAKMTGKSESELNDPKYRQAFDAMAAVDAGKSYAFTKTLGVSAKYCGPSVKAALKKYKSKVSDIIAQGKQHYISGIQVKLGSQEISYSSKELSDGLNDLLKKLDSQHKSANQTNLKSKCKEAEQMLKFLTKAYGS